MTRVVRCLLWDLADSLRTTRSQPATLVLATLGSTLAVAGFAVGAVRMGAAAGALWEAGDVERLLDGVAWGSRLLTLLLVLGGPPQTVAGLFQGRSLRLFRQLRQLPLSDTELHAVRTARDTLGLLLLLVPSTVALGVSLVLHGLPPGLVATILLVPYVLVVAVFGLVRVTTLLLLLALPRRWLDWRLGLVLAGLGIALAVEPMRAAMDALTSRAATTPVVWTDWPVAILRRWLAGRPGEAWALSAAAVAVAALAFAVDFLCFRHLVLRRFDAVMTRATSAARHGRLATAAVRALTRAFAIGLDRGQRAVVRADLLWIARDPALSLSVLAPAVAAVVAAATLEILMGLPLGEPGELTLAAGGACLAFLLLAWGAVLPALLVTHEGPRLGVLRAAPADTADLLAGKRRAATVATVLCWWAALGTGAACAARWTDPVGTTTLLVALGAATLAAHPVARFGVAAGCLFGRHDAANPLLTLGMPGLAIQIALSGLAASSLAASLLAVTKLGATWTLLPIGVILVWDLVAGFLEAEARRAARDARLGRDAREPRAGRGPRAGPEEAPCPIPPPTS